MPEHSGSCHCGEVRIRLKSDPMIVHACHCRDCQKQTGGPFALNGIIEADRVELETGSVETALQTTDSGRPHTIHQCPTCRSALWSLYGKRDVIRFVKIAALDAPGVLRPGVHIFTRTKLPWITLDDGAPIYEAFYKASDVWADGSIARWEAVTGLPEPFTAPKR